jgi:hypothetical protein
MSELAGRHLSRTSKAAFVSELIIRLRATLAQGASGRRTEAA